MRPARHHSDRISTAAARAQLAQLLCGCTDAKLDSFSADGLASMYRVPRKEIEYELQMARQRRGRAA